MIELKSHRLRREISELELQLSNHQDKCKHKRATFTNHASTGNYDPSCDRYWKDYVCPTCLKRWSVDT